MSKIVKRWDTKDVPENFIMYLVSCKNSGKTTLLLHLYRKQWEDEFDFVIVLCGNQHCAAQYKKVVPGKYVHSKYSPQIIHNYFETCDRLIKQKRELPRVLFILDDVVRMTSTKEQKRTMNDSGLHRMFTQHRHYNVSCVLAVQNIACGTSSWSRNCDLFICSPSSLHNGNDFEMISAQYMGYSSGNNKQNNLLILEEFDKYEFLVLQFHKSSRKRNELIRCYKITKEEATLLQRLTW